MIETEFKTKDYIELIIIIIIILIIRSHILEPFRVPSGSMKPNLLNGDFVFTNKFIYCIQLPFSSINIKIKKPTHGDVIMFKKDKIKYVKRIISLPEATIKYKNKQIYINKIKIKKKIVSIISTQKNTKLYYIQEFLIPKKEYFIKNKTSKNNGYDFIKTLTKHKKYFVLGDNRDNSEDSRDLDTINYTNIKGKVFKIWLSVDIKNIDIRWNRIFKTIT